MKVTIEHKKAEASTVLEDVNVVTRHPEYIYVRRGDESWTYPWRVVLSVHIEDSKAG